MRAMASGGAAHRRAAGALPASLLLLLAPVAAQRVADFLPERNATRLYPDLTCADMNFTCPDWSCTTQIRAANVRIADVAAGDRLACGDCDALGIAAAYEPVLGRLRMTGDLTVSAYISALRSVTFETDAWGGGGSRDVIGNFGHGLIMGPADHFYEYYPFPVAAAAIKSWEAAQRACADVANDVLGLPGYLATLVSEEENEAMPEAWADPGYLGASDYGQESIWRWVTGPEGCQPDGTGAGAVRTSCDLGFPIDPTATCGGPDCDKGLLFAAGVAPRLTTYTYSGFNRQEPDQEQRSKEQDFVVSRLKGVSQWGDARFADDQAKGYYCEWGGIGGLCMGIDTVKQLVTLLASNVNECVATCPTCGTCPPDQKCNDPNQNFGAFSDWQCECVLPLTGVQRAGPAECVLDECLSDCPTCENDVCVRQSPAQVCNDPNTAINSTDDWVCACAFPLTTLPSSYDNGQRIGDCALDECAAPCRTCAGSTCSDAGQLCVDPDTSPVLAGDWQCRCEAPQTGVGNGTAAVCELDECTVKCATCAPEDFCPRGFQSCFDPDKDSDALATWGCLCDRPGQGFKPLAVTTCILDECTSDCFGCAGTTCSDEGQLCEDLDRTWTATVKSRRDWTCRCRAPELGVGLQQAAACQLDECDALCSDCENDRCSDGGQECEDPDYGKRLTWQCRCRAPEEGVALTNLALCSLDECKAACDTCAGMICEVADQDCRDPDMQARGDWECVCRDFLTGSQVAGVAGCTLDECTAPCLGCNMMACEGAGQMCSDDNTDARALGDWYCTCIPPYNGTAVHKPAVCAIDECVEECETCEEGLCETKPFQECRDPELTVVNDWTCECVEPYYVAPTASRKLPAMAVKPCVLDECEFVCDFCENDVCSDAEQDCRDANTTESESWECLCRAPRVGNTTLEVAECILDECLADCRDCGDRFCVLAGQVCVDPNMTEIATGDWYCDCAAPKITNSTTPTKHAACNVDECVADCSTCERGLCATANQTCEDLDVGENSLMNWVCKCRPPATAAVVEALREITVCYLDECEYVGEDCPTCAGTTCSDVGQNCTDRTLNATGDWVCLCRPPFTGATVGAPADDCVPPPTPLPTTDVPSPPTMLPTASPTTGSPATASPPTAATGAPSTTGSPVNAAAATGDDESTLKLLLAVAIGLFCLINICAIIFCLRKYLKKDKKQTKRAREPVQDVRLVESTPQSTAVYHPSPLAHAHRGATVSSIDMDSSTLPLHMKRLLTDPADDSMTQSAFFASEMGTVNAKSFGADSEVMNASTANASMTFLESTRGRRKPFTTHKEPPPPPPVLFELPEREGEATPLALTSMRARAGAGGGGPSSPGRINSVRELASLRKFDTFRDRRAGNGVGHRESLRPTGGSTAAPRERGATRSDAPSPRDRKRGDAFVTPMSPGPLRQVEPRSPVTGLPATPGGLVRSPLESRRAARKGRSYFEDYLD